MKDSFGDTGGPVFNASYEYRIRKYIAFETGVNTSFSTSYFPIGGQVSILAGTNLLQTYGSLSAFTRGTARSETVPFGFRGVLPVAQGKGELFVGGGGAYLWSGDQNSSKSWAAQTSLGARFAVDKQRHVWLGTTARYIHGFGVTPQSWITWTADLGYRFGH